MKRSVTLPHSRGNVYHALKDPILLAGWLDIPYVSTGYGKLHLFELEDWTSDTPWKTRGFIVDDVRGKGFRVEKDEVGDHRKPVLALGLSDTEEGCVLEMEWDDPYFDRVTRQLLDTGGHLRLGHLLNIETVILPEASE